MWWDKSEVEHVYLSGSRLWWRGPKEEAYAESHRDPVDALTRLARGRTERPRFAIWLGGDLCRVLGCGTPEGARDRAEAELALTLSLQSQRTARSGEQVRILATGKPGVQTLVALVHSAVIEQIEALRAKRFISVCGLRPWWSGCLPESKPERRPRTLVRNLMLAAFDEETLTLLAFDSSGLLLDARSQAQVSSTEEAQRVTTRWSIAFESGWPTCAHLQAHPLDRMREQTAGSARTFGFRDRVALNDRF